MVRILTRKFFLVGVTLKTSLLFQTPPIRSVVAADLILPTCMWVEKKGSYGNAERRTQLWRQQVKGPGESRSDFGKLSEFSKYFKTDEVWGEEFTRSNARISWQDFI